MTKELIRRDSAFNLEELQTLVSELVELYGDHHPSTIYLDPKPIFALEEETLTDGSKVLNLHVTLRDCTAASGYRRGRTDYGAIAAEAADPNTQPVDVTEEEYEEMLGCVPPIYVPGGFLVGEALTGHDLGTVFAHYAKRGDRYLARYAIHGRPETYIKA